MPLWATWIPDMSRCISYIFTMFYMYFLCIMLDMSGSCVIIYYLSPIASCMRFIVLRLGQVTKNAQGYCSAGQQPLQQWPQTPRFIVLPVVIPIIPQDPHECHHVTMCQRQGHVRWPTACWTIVSDSWMSKLTCRCFTMFHRFSWMQLVFSFPFVEVVASSTQNSWRLCFSNVPVADCIARWRLSFPRPCRNYRTSMIPRPLHEPLHAAHGALKALGKSEAKWEAPKNYWPWPGSKPHCRGACHGVGGKSMANQWKSQWQFCRRSTKQSDLILAPKRKLAWSIMSHELFPLDMTVHDFPTSWLGRLPWMQAAVLRRALQKHETPEDEMKEEAPRGVWRHLHHVKISQQPCMHVVWCWLNSNLQLVDSMLILNISNFDCSLSPSWCFDFASVGAWSSSKGRRWCAGTGPKIIPIITHAHTHTTYTYIMCIYIYSIHAYIYVYMWSAALQGLPWSHWRVPWCLRILWMKSI